MQQRDDDARACGSHRMAEGDRAAVDVGDIPCKFQRLLARKIRRGERFIQLDEMDIVHRQAGLLERLGHRQRRA